MLESALVYSGLILTLVGLVLIAKPRPRLGVATRVRASLVMDAGILLTIIGVFSPAPESRVDRPGTRLDELAPRWQFREFHTIRVAAPPARAFEAVKSVRADEIFLFRALTWIRRGGQSLPESILNAGDRDPLIEVALRDGFVSLADDPPRELVIGTAVHTPEGARDSLTPELFRHPPPGYTVAAMNFLVKPDGANGSIVSTETRVFANGSATKRRFAAYWRVIYPGSAIIRRMWLRAVRERATSPQRTA